MGGRGTDTSELIYRERERVGKGIVGEERIKIEH